MMEVTELDFPCAQRADMQLRAGFPRPRVCSSPRGSQNWSGRCPEVSRETFRGPNHRITVRFWNTLLWLRPRVRSAGSADRRQRLRVWSTACAMRRRRWAPRARCAQVTSGSLDARACVREVGPGRRRMRGKPRFRDRWKCAAGGAAALVAAAFRRFVNCFGRGSTNVGMDLLRRLFVRCRKICAARFGFRPARSGTREYSGAREELCRCAVT